MQTLTALTLSLPKTMRNILIVASLALVSFATVGCGPSKEDADAAASAASSAAKVDKTKPASTTNPGQAAAPQAL